MNTESRIFAAKRKGKDEKEKYFLLTALRSPARHGPDGPRPAESGMAADGTGHAAGPSAPGGADTLPPLERQ